MVFKDGSIYTGTFVNNNMSCPNGVFEYSNGDRYEGVIETGKKSGAGGTYYYKNGDTYEGPFMNDKKHGEAKMVFPGINTRFQGTFRNDEKIGPCQIEFGNHGKFLGEMDINEELSGKNSVFEFTKQKMVYVGEFQGNNMHGQGELQNLETKNKFQGTFFNGAKYGPGKFILSDGIGVFSGVFEYNVEKSGNYGKRY